MVAPVPSAPPPGRARRDLAPLALVVLGFGALAAASSAASGGGGTIAFPAGLGAGFVGYAVLIGREPWRSWFARWIRIFVLFGLAALSLLLLALKLTLGTFSVAFLHDGVDGLRSALVFATIVTILIDRRWRALVFPKKAPALRRAAPAPGRPA